MIITTSSSQHMALKLHLYYAALGGGGKDAEFSVTYRLLCLISKVLVDTPECLAPRPLVTEDQRDDIGRLEM